MTIYFMTPLPECLSGISCLKITTKEITLIVLALIYFIREQRHLETFGCYPVYMLFDSLAAWILLHW